MLQSVRAETWSRDKWGCSVGQGISQFKDKVFIELDIEVVGDLQVNDLRGRAVRRECDVPLMLPAGPKSVSVEKMLPGGLGGAA